MNDQEEQDMLLEAYDRRQKLAAMQQLDKALTGVENKTESLSEATRRVEIKMNQVVAHAQMSMRRRFKKEMANYDEEGTHDINAKHIFTRVVFPNHTIGWECEFYDENNDLQLFRLHRNTEHCILEHFRNDTFITSRWCEWAMWDVYITTALMMNANSVNDIYFE